MGVMWRGLFGMAFQVIAITEVLAQVNLVMNNDFEDYTTCPYAGSFPVALPNWTFQYASADYFNRCNIGSWGVPSNVFGNQDVEIDNNGYIGLTTYTSNFSGFQESARGNLSQPLQAGVNYRVRFRASMADNQMYSTCCVGIILSTQPPPNPPYQTNLSDAELIIPVAQYDTISWFQLDTTYTATGGEDKIYIGCFRPEATMNPVITNPDAQSYAYFYIDDVEVYEDSLLTALPENIERENTIGYEAGAEAINVSIGGKAEFMLTEVTGKVMLVQQLERGSHSVPVANLPIGVYVARVAYATGEVVSKRVVVWRP
jgi:hypothetical protein